MNQLICKKCNNIQEDCYTFCLNCKEYIQGQDLKLKWWHVALWLILFVPLTCYGLYSTIREFR